MRIYRPYLACEPDSINVEMPGIATILLTQRQDGTITLWGCELDSQIQDTIERALAHE